MRCCRLSEGCLVLLAVTVLVKDVVSFEAERNVIKCRGMKTGTSSSALYGFSLNNKKGWRMSSSITKRSSSRRRFPVMVQKKQEEENAGTVPLQEVTETTAEAWNSIKDFVYGAADGVQKMGDTLSTKDNKTSGSIIEDGYSTVESTVFSSSTPGQRLMQEYQARSSPSIPPPEPVISTNAFSEFMDTTKKEPQQPRQRQQQQRRNNKNDNDSSSWDTFKEAIYGTVDLASALFDGKSGSNKDNGQRNNRTIGGRTGGIVDGPTTTTMTTNTPTTTTFKPLVQPTLAGSEEVRDALQNLNSNNPITKKVAEWTIQDWEEKQKRAKRKLEREKAAKEFKENVYAVGDSILWGVDQVSQVPGKVSKAVSETEKTAKKVVSWAKTVPETVDNTVQEIQSIPNKVQKTANDVQNTVEEGVRTTQKVVQDVQAIPSKVEKTVQETQKNVQSVANAVDETATNLKVLVGLEKPKPKPPKLPPPPPKTASELGWQLAGDLTSGTLKAAWWIGKGTTIAAFNGAKFAVEKGTEAIMEQQNTSPKTPPQLQSKVDQEVEQEVEDALKLAQNAIAMAEVDAYTKEDDTIADRLQNIIPPTKQTDAKNNKTTRNQMAGSTARRGGRGLGGGRRLVSWFSSLWRETWD